MKELRRITDLKSYHIRECYIYGLGTTGRLLVDLQNILNIDIQGVIVGAGYKTTNHYKGVKIIELSDKIICKNINIIYTVKKKLDLLIDPYFEEKLIDASSVEFYHELLFQWYDIFFEERKIKERVLQDEIIDIQGYKFYNPMLLNKTFRNSFIYELGDVLLPELWNNFERIDEGPYENENVRFANGDVVVDCGANIGLFSTIAAWKGAKVYAFEPVAEFCGFIERNSLLYEDLITCINKGLWDVSCEAKICGGGYRNFYK